MGRFTRRVGWLVYLDLAERNRTLLPEIFEQEFALGQRAARGVSERVADLRLIEIIRQFEFHVDAALDIDCLAFFELFRADAEAGVDDGRRRGDLEGENHRARLVRDRRLHEQWGFDALRPPWSLDRLGIMFGASLPAAQRLGRGDPGDGELRLPERRGLSLGGLLLA